MERTDLNEKIEFLKTLAKEKNITYDQIASRSNIPISTVKKVFSGITKTPRIDTVQAIERALELDKPQPTALADKQTSELAENFIREYGDLLKEKAFNDLAKLYKAVDIANRIFIVSSIVGYLNRNGVNTELIVGY